MPQGINLDVANGIIAAFNTGFNERQQQADRVQAKKIQDEKLKLDQEQEASRKKELQEKQAIDEKHFQLQQQAEKLVRDLQIANIHRKNFEESGVVPEGYGETSARSIQLGEGKAGTLHKFATSQLGAPNFEAADPITAATQRANLEDITLRPKYEAEEQLKLKLAQQAAEDKAFQKEADFRQQLARDAQNNSLRLEIAKLNNASREDIAALKRQLDNDKLLTPEESKIFAVPYGTKRSEVFGKEAGEKLTETQQADLGALDDAENKLMEIQSKLDPKFGGIGYGSYFKGLSPEGIALDFARKSGLSRDKKLQDIAPVIGEYEGKVAKARGGTSFTPNEQKLLESYLLTPSHSQDPGDADSKVNAALKGIRELRATKLSEFGHKVIQKSPNRIKVDANGNEIENIPAQEIKPSSKLPQSLDAIQLEEDSNLTSNVASNNKLTVAQRHNNPLNLKLGGATKKLVDLGIAEVGEKSTDGGNFLKFKNENEGYQAALGLLSSDVYADLTVDSAMKKWSNSGYSSDVAPTGIKADQKIKDLTFLQKAELVKAMAHREGFN